MALQWSNIALQTTLPSDLSFLQPTNHGECQAHSTTLYPQGKTQLMSHHHLTGLSDHFDICQLSTSAHLKQKPPAPTADTHTPFKTIPTATPLSKLTTKGT